MQILSIKEFNALCNTDGYTKKIYQGKTLVGGPVFSLSDVKAAQSYCKIFNSQHGEKICLVVEDKNFLRIWNEADITKEERGVDAILASSEKQKAFDLTMLVEIEFTNNCQELLAKYIGPVAQIICKKTLAKQPNLSHQEFVEILAKKISDSQQAKEFKQQLLK